MSLPTRRATFFVLALGLAAAGLAAQPPAGPCGDGPPPLDDFFERFDANGDGQVSRAEFRGPAHAFDHLDANGDGVVEASEIPEKPPGGTAVFFDRFDADGDGVVSRSEFEDEVAGRDFDHFDADGDGVIDESEAPEGPPCHRPPPRGQRRRGGPPGGEG